MGWASDFADGITGNIFDFNDGDDPSGGRSDDLRMSRERMKMMREGREEGRLMGERVTGQSQEQTGIDVGEIVNRRRELMRSPSSRSDAIRRKGQQAARYSKSKGASDVQQRNVEYQSAQAAGLAQDQDYERRVQDFQSLIGNIMSAQSSLELGGGQLGIASQYISPPQEQKGFLAKLGL